jgi:hypothetical protein
VIVYRPCNVRLSVVLQSEIGGNIITQPAYEP